MNHRISTAYHRKIALSAMDTKQYVLACGKCTFSLGSCHIKKCHKHVCNKIEYWLIKNWWQYFVFFCSKKKQNMSRFDLSFKLPSNLLAVGPTSYGKMSWLKKAGWKIGTYCGGPFQNAWFFFTKNLNRPTLIWSGGWTTTIEKRGFANFHIWRNRSKTQRYTGNVP